MPPDDSSVCVPACSVWARGYTGGCRAETGGARRAGCGTCIVQRVMRRAILLLLLSTLAGCGSSWVERTAAAGEQPRVEALRIEDIPRDTLALPNAGRSIKFAIIGDSGRGSKEQHEVAAQMAAFRQRFDFTFVLMVGD